MAKRKKKGVIKKVGGKAPGGGEEKPVTLEIDGTTLIPVDLATIRDAVTLINNTPSPNFPVSMAVSVLARFQAAVGSVVGQNVNLDQMAPVVAAPVKKGESK